MGAPIRIAHIDGKYRDGGVETVIFNYWEHIDRNRVQFDLICDEDSPLPLPYERVEALGGHIFTVPPYQKLLAYKRALGKLFAENGWPVVHSHINALSVFPLGVAKHEGVPVRIAHSHSTAGRGENWKRVVLKNILRTQSNRYSTYRLACSRCAGEWLFGSAHFDVLPNAIDLDRFCFDAAERERKRREFGAGPNTFVVGHVGRLMEQKNHAFLLRAFAELLKMVPDSMLVLVGDGELNKDIRGQAEAADLSEKIVFAGHRKDVASYYSAFDAFALPSLYEGLGIVGVEAQRAGLPCLLSDVITREVDVTGKVRFLPIDNPLEWAEALAEIGVGNRIPVCDSDFVKYDIHQTAELLCTLYEDLAGSVS